jgi:hypothetical protein
MTIPKPPPAPGRRRQLALLAATAVWRMLRPGRALATAHCLTGFPARHPESPPKKLPRRHERSLAERDPRPLGPCETFMGSGRTCGQDGADAVLGKTACAWHKASAAEVAALALRLTRGQS